MSDIYVELRSMIPVVAARTHIGRDRLRQAQETVGLSNERLARLIPVSEKTWRRWRDAGEVPTYALPQVAKALRLELVREPAVAVQAQDGDALLQEVLESVAGLLDMQGELLSRLSRLEVKLDGLAERRAGRRARDVTQQ